MANIILFHSIMGLRPGVLTTAERLKEKGHQVFTPDLINGEIFDAMDVANQHFQKIGVPEMMKRAYLSLQSLPADVYYMGFSFGGVCSLKFAASRPGAKGCIALHAAVPIAALGIKEWPAGIPVQVHFADKDVWKKQEAIDLLAENVRASGSSFEYFGYPLDGHLFTDPDLPEYNRDAAELLMQRVEQFLV
jgi:dienelactone hydrolase